VNTLEFLKAILPEEGIHYLALFKEGYKFPAHKAYTDLETMAYAIDGMAKSNQVSVYHACATYQKAVIELDELDSKGNPKRKYRIPENWDRAKAFWVDIDCGQDKFDKGDGYLTKKDAVMASYKFADTIGWPKPMIVDSGNGIHLYWPLTKDISHNAWRKVASILKATLAHEGVIADPTRTADFSSILRPAGSVNRKHGAAKPVVVKTQVEASDPKELATKLHEYAVANGVKLIKEAPKRERVVSDLNSDLTAHLTQYPEVPVDANLMADKCAQVAAMRDTKGDVSYDHWRFVIGLLTHCENGRSLAQDWSAEREATGHTNLDWDVRYDTWNSGPTVCETFEGCNPDGCKGCPMKGKVATPLMLGRVMPASEETTEEVVTEEGETEEATIPALPPGYQWDGRLLSRLLPDREGVLQALPFCENLFYPITRIRGEDGTFKYGIRFHLPDKRIRDFDITGESVASPTDLLRALAKYELTKSNHKDAGNHMAAYLLDQLQALKRRIVETNTITTFGWKEQHKAFLLGDTMYRSDGSATTVLVGSNAKNKMAAFPKNNGSLESYAESLNFMYNRPGALHWQYAICAGWGSLLSHHCEDLYNGLLMALQGGDTGRGKTTVCHAAMAAFGDPKNLTLNSKEGFTPAALWANLGVYSNIPILVDELTNMDPKDFSDMAYGVSNGKERERMKSTGGMVTFATPSFWRMNVYITGNRDFHGLLSLNQTNSQAEAVRLVQINIDKYPPLVLADRSLFPMDKDGELAWRAASALVAAENIKKMTANSGHAGAAMVKYILTNEAAVAKAMQDMLGHLTKEVPSPKYRFYRAHSACAIVIAQIAKKLGIIEFDVKSLYKFTVTLIKELAESITETNTVTVDDAFNRMVNELSPRILITNEYRDKRDGRGPETPRNRVNGIIAGRYVIGSQNHKEMAGHLVLVQKEVRDWCMKHRIEYSDVLANLNKAGALLKHGEKFTLTRGTDQTNVQQRCIIVDTGKLDSDSISAPALSVVSTKFDGAAVNDV
jgi:hypothetical protein